jgi:hypothetical protein
MGTELTWDRIAELEPRVLALLDEIKAERPLEHTFQCVWNEYHRRLSALVGWGVEGGEHPELGTSEAYNIVFHKLHAVLLYDKGLIEDEKAHRDLHRKLRSDDACPRCGMPGSY